MAKKKKIKLYLANLVTKQLSHKVLVRAKRKSKARKFVIDHYGDGQLDVKKIPKKIKGCFDDFAITKPL